MRRRMSVSFLALVLIVLACATSSLAVDSTNPIQFVPVQEGFRVDAPTVLPYAPDRLLVQFTEDAVERLDLQIASERGVTVYEAVTGLRSVDAIAGRAAVRSIERPFKMPANEQEVIRLGIDRWFMYHFDAPGDLPSLARSLEADPNIEAVSLDWRAFPAAVPNDPYHSDNWGHNNTAQLPSYNWSTHTHTGPLVGTVGFDANAQAAWDASQGYGDPGVIVAILDSGVDIDHDDLRLVAGYDYGDNDTNPDDNSSAPGHGTACAGVAAAIVNNSMEVNGAAGGSSIMPLKVANSAGSMYFSAIINAIYHAADNGADVVSMSFSADISSDASTDAALQYAYNAGCVLLAATSNENESHIRYPANHAYVIGVGAASPCGDRKRSSSSSTDCNPGVSTDPNGYTCDGERWWGSCYGVTTQDAAGAVDVIAPTILPTTDIEGSGGYMSGDVEPYFNGTSCATPYAAGVCALIKSANPTWTPAQIRDQLCDTAIDIINVESGSGWDRYSGYGMVDAEAAVGGGGGPVPPTAAFTGSPLSGTFPLTVDFNDQSAGAPTSWSWTFGDGGTSGAQNPSHNYTSGGTYTVALTVYNSEGNDTETKTNYITVMDPADTYASLPYSMGFEGGGVDQYWTTASTTEGRIQFSTSYSPHGGSYQMLMDDSVNGSVYATNEAWLHLNLGGETDVELDFWWQDFSDETHTQDGVYFSDDEGNSFVKVYDIAGASVTNQTWQNAVLDVDALASANGLSMSSTFVVKFQQYDNYGITTDGLGFDDISVTGVTGTPPVAAFSGTPTSGTTPLTVNFTDASTGATSWSWVFGDGGTSTAQNPSHQYTAAGTYTVTLTATNAYGSDDEVKTNYITVSDPPPPTAAFSGTPTSGTTPLTVTFTDASTGAPTSWSWVFGDGGTSTAQNPSHQYAAAGTYTVTLTATNAYGSDDEVKTNYITVSDPPPPTAAFSGTPTTGVEPLTVTFTDASTGSPTSWSWAFGDGGTSTAQNPTHDYLSAGTYTVTLTATNAYGSDGETKTDYITVNPCNAPVAAFTGSPTGGDAPLYVSFTDQSTNSPTSWSWSFGDGGTSTAQNPSHTYTVAGTYTVSLTATNPCGSDGETKTDYVTVTEPAGWTVITYDDFEGGFGSYTDGGGDCFLYTSGTYAHQGSNAGGIQDNSGVASSFYHTNGYDVSGYTDLEVEFWFRAYSMDNTSEDFWVQYYDGSTWHTVASYARTTDFENNIFYNKVVSIPSGTYNYPGDAKLRFMCDASGNADDIYLDEIEFRGAGTAPPQPPTAEFAGTPTSGFFPLDVTFTDMSIGSPTSWSWTFGDGGTSGAQNPVHTYTTAGTYTVSLTAANGEGDDAETKTGYITVSDPGAGGWMTITYDDFEGGWGNYTDGGGDCALYTGGTYAHQGTNAAEIRDNTGVASSFYHTTGYDVSSYTDLEVEFWYLPHSMDRTGEDFWVQYYDGSTWHTVAVFDRNTDFQNDVFYHEVVQIPAGTYAYPSDAQLRFMCDASGNQDWIYIDELEFRGYYSGAAPQSNEFVDAGTTAPVKLMQNRPNPFNPVTKIAFALSQETDVTLQVYDVRGQLVTTLVDRKLGAGDHTYVWDARDAASGIYFCRIQTPEFSETKKMTLLK